jgi:hypothetical protein
VTFSWLSGALRRGNGRLLRTPSPVSVKGSSGREGHSASRLKITSGEMRANAEKSSLGTWGSVE